MAQKACFVILSFSPSFLFNDYIAVNLVFKQKENCQLSSQIRQSLPYHSQVAKRCWACPRVVIFCVTSGLIWTAHNYVVKIDRLTEQPCRSYQRMILLAQLGQPYPWGFVKLLGLPLYIIGWSVPAPGRPQAEVPDTSNYIPIIVASAHIKSLLPSANPTGNILFSLPSSGYAGYKLCYYEVMKVIKGIVHQPYEVKGSSVFYAFSYYFDRAVESGLIGEWTDTKESPTCCHYLSQWLSSFAHSWYLDYMFCFFFSCTDGTRGGALEVRDFKKRAKEGMRSTLSCLWTDELVYISDFAILYTVCIYM